MVGGHRIAQHSQHARAQNVCDRRGSLGDAVEVRRFSNVGRVRLPLVHVACGETQALPVGVAHAHRRVFAAKAFAGQPLFDGRSDLGLRGPDVLEIDRLTSLICSERIGIKVMADLACQRIGDNQRRAHQIIGTHVNIHAALEVTVAAQHAYGNQSMLVDALRNIGRQRTGVTDARGAAITHHVEAQLFKVRQQSGFGVVVGDDA